MCLSLQLCSCLHRFFVQVHERSVDGDFLLLELKDLLSKNSHIKVILMSATINQATFVNYYNGAPLITIPGLAYRVEDQSVPFITLPYDWLTVGESSYLEDVFPFIDYRPQGARPTKKVSEEESRGLEQELQAKGLNESSINAIQSISRSDRIDYQVCTGCCFHSRCLLWCTVDRICGKLHRQQETTGRNSYISYRCSGDTAVHAGFERCFGPTSRYLTTSRELDKR